MHRLQLDGDIVQVWAGPENELNEFVIFRMSRGFRLCPC